MANFIEHWKAQCLILERRCVMLIAYGSTIDVPSVTDAAKVIADLGMTVVISAVVLVFLGRVLNTMVRQVDTTYQSILPELKKISDDIASAKNIIVEGLSNHNTVASKRLYEIRADVSSMEKNIQHLVERFDELDNLVRHIDAQLASTPQAKEERFTKQTKPSSEPNDEEYLD